MTIEQLAFNRIHLLLDKFEDFSADRYKVIRYGKV
jgi:hypothetical protein